MTLLSALPRSWILSLSTKEFQEIVGIVAGLLTRDRRTAATTDGAENTYRSGGCVCVTDAGAVHAHITTASVGVSPSINGSWSPPVRAHNYYTKNKQQPHGFVQADSRSVPGTPHYTLRGRIVRWWWLISPRALLAKPNSPANISENDFNIWSDTNTN